MTGNGNQISVHNWIYFTFSGGGDQAAHTDIRIAKVSSLRQLIDLLSDSKTVGNLNF